MLFLTLAGCSPATPRELDSAGGAPSTLSTSDPDPTAEPATEPSSSGSSEATDPGQTSDPTPTTMPTDEADGGGSTTGVGPEQPPAESEAQTLCNLTYEYVLTLYVHGTADDGAYLEVAALSLSDSLRVWRGLVADYPAAEPAVERAQSVHDLWKEAISVLAEGDVDKYQDLLAQSEDAIEQLPRSASAKEIECT